MPWMQWLGLSLSSVRLLPPLLARSLGLARESELREQQTWDWREQQQQQLQQQQQQQQQFLDYEAAAARRRSATWRDAAWDAVAFERRAPTDEQLARIYPPLEVLVLLFSIFLSLLSVIFAAVSGMWRAMRSAICLGATGTEPRSALTVRLTTCSLAQGESLALLPTSESLRSLCFSTQASAARSEGFLVPG